jgi:SnoaL-like domain
MNLPDSHQAQLDREEIRGLIYRYCRAVDRLDVELGQSIWHDDGVADYGADIYQGSGRGLIDFICAQHRRALRHSHQMSNILITLEGDRAGSESYVTATLRVQSGDQQRQITVWSRYVDQWSRRGGRWGLDKRVMIRDFDEMRAVDAISESDRGRRDRDDPSYAAVGTVGQLGVRS